MKKTMLLPSLVAGLFLLTFFNHVSFGANQSQTVSLDRSRALKGDRPVLMFNGGPNFSKLITNSGSGDSRSQSGLFLGVEGDFPVSESLSIRTGVNYVERGVTLDSGGTTSDTLLNYVSLPFLAGLKIAESQSSQFSLFMGPYAAVAVDRVSSGEGSSQNIEDSVHSFDFGMRGGAELNFDLSENYLAGIQMFYDRGIKNLSKTGSSIIKNESIIAAIGLGVKL